MTAERGSVGGVGDEPKKSREARTREFLESADALQQICDHVASGGSLVDLANTMDIRFADLSRFIYNDPERLKKWTDALKLRDEWFYESIIGELRKIANVDLRRLFGEDGKMLDLKDIPADVAQALQSVDVEESYIGTGSERVFSGYTKKVKLWDKLKALELLMKKHKMLADVHEVKGRLTLEDLLAGSRPQTPAVPDAPG